MLPLIALFAILGFVGTACSPGGSTINLEGVVVPLGNIGPIDVPDLPLGVNLPLLGFCGVNVIMPDVTLNNVTATLGSVSLDLATQTGTASNVSVTTGAIEVPLSIPVVQCLGLTGPSAGAGTLTIPALNVTTNATINLATHTMTLGGGSFTLAGVGYSIDIPFPIIGNQTFAATLPLNLTLPLPTIAVPLP
jgi:hypothetical protein